MPRGPVRVEQAVQVVRRSRSTPTWSAAPATVAVTVRPAGTIT
jgi:hypothetical protein